MTTQKRTSKTPAKKRRQAAAPKPEAKRKRAKESRKAEPSVRVQSAESSASISAAVAQQTEQVRSSQDGVNLDEEAARLIQFQQSYQAAAKVLQVPQSLFDTLLDATR